MTNYVTLRLAEDTVAKFRRLSRELSVTADRNLSQSEVFEMLLALGAEHREQLEGLARG